ncbi:hypothetical protein DR950_39495 [Kitasatospora xanthocidica]|uniref:Uncharacterized protein n=1 Tax=Kitasatospora xanthocidica TaxID=83382 RepID=A0A372ZJL4_9ACTN|nr:MULTISPECIES: hypothetical protein [Streptomycetaceae]OKI03330.1 ATP-binding protein [Streptomyces sp. CB02056]RGD55457.1 hypothetical protein DR950_39495 [Kitasatospora xanthocidica]
MRKTPAVRRPLPTSPFKPRPDAPPKLFAVGDRVSHDKYGLGRVLAVEDGAYAAVLVDFGTRQERIAPPYAALFTL